MSDKLKLDLAVRSSAASTPVILMAARVPAAAAIRTRAIYQGTESTCFIQRAKAMNFSLEEITRLLEMRHDPQHARDDVRELRQSHTIPHI